MKNKLEMNENPFGMGYQLSKDKVEQQMKQFSRLLVDKGKALSKRQIKSLDTIDMRNAIISYGKDTIGPNTAIPDSSSLTYLVEQAQKIDKEKIGDTFLANSTFFEYLPCFEEGVFHINKNRWLYFKIEELLLNQDGNISNFCSIRLKDYSFSVDAGWSAGVECVLEVADGSHKDVEIKATSSVLFHDIYSQFDADTLKKELGWSSSDIQFWEMTIVKHAIETEKELTNEKGECQEIVSILILYCTFVIYVNNKLLKNKLSHGRKPQGQKKGSVKSEFNKESEQPAKLVRTVGEGAGSVAITSQKPPRNPSEEYVRHYSVASWKVCGHIRTYKSGKTVYIKETVFHRHGFEKQEKEASLPQRVVRLQSKIKEKEHE